jgi:short-subunit dehydrogenase
MDKWALITGASSGIGCELAKLFAADNCNLVLVARNEARLRQLAEELQAQHKISTRIIAKDLSRPEAPGEVFEILKDIPVSVLVNNAGAGILGPFVKCEFQRSLEIMRLNMGALTNLTHLFVQPMLERGQGRIMNIASTAAFQPGPFTAIYFATKAFVFSFSVALAEELTGTGVTVTTVCPGATQTEFFARAEMEGTRNQMFMMNAGTVARIAYRATMKGKAIVSTGLINKLSSSVAKALPARMTAKIVRKINRA